MTFASPAKISCCAFRPRRLACAIRWRASSALCDVWGPQWQGGCWWRRRHSLRNKCHALGFVDAVYQADSLHAAAQRYVESLIKLAPMSVTSMLEIIRQLEGGNLNRERADALAKACSDSDRCAGRCHRPKAGRGHPFFRIGDPELRAVTMLGLPRLDVLPLLCR